MTTSFFIRTTLKDKNKTVKIRMRLRDGKDVNLFGVTREQIKIEYWSFEKNAIKQRLEFPEKEDLKAKLRDLQGRIEELYRMEHEKARTDSNWLKNTIDRFYNPGKYRNGKPQSLFQFIQDFIERSKTRSNPKTGRPVGDKQQREYKRTFHYLQEFCRKKGREYDFIDIDMDFYQDFVEYMQSENLATNTIGKKIQTLKIMLNDANYKDYSVNKAFKNPKFKSISEESDAIYLNEEELRILYDLDLSEKTRLESIRDIFLIGCWTGIRFGDIHKINTHNIKDGKLHLVQSKTGKPVVIPLHPIVKRILGKYDYQLPRIISNQKFNDYLKDVAKAAKLKEEVHKTITRGGIQRSTSYEKWQLVTTHTARRSFATNLYKSGFPSRSIMEITGHNTESAFLKYIKVTPEEHAQLLESHWEKQNHLKVV